MKGLAYFLPQKEDPSQNGRLPTVLCECEHVYEWKSGFFVPSYLLACLQTPVYNLDPCHWHDKEKRSALVALFFKSGSFYFSAMTCTVPARSSPCFPHSILPQCWSELLNSDPLHIPCAADGHHVRPSLIREVLFLEMGERIAWALRHVKLEH